MNRPSYALALLLAALGGPLFLAGTARSETPSTRPVCTPPVVAVHPVDLFNSPLPCPGYINEYGDQDLAAGTDTAHDAAAEQAAPRVANTPLGNQYDDLFETLRDAAGKAIAAFQTKIVEVDPSAYNADAPQIPAYEPYAEEHEATEEAAVESAAGETSPVAGYESQFSGYGPARDTYHYAPVKNFDLDKVIAEHNRFAIDRFAFSVWEQASNSQLVAQTSDYVNEAHSLYQELACEYPFERLVDASEAAWDRVEEYNRLNAPQPATLAVGDRGYRLPYDDCGWECDYAWQSGLSNVSPSPLAPRGNVTKREALVSLARSLRGMASQLEAASNLIAQWGGIDLAELQQDKAAR